MELALEVTPKAHRFRRCRASSSRGPMPQAYHGSTPTEEVPRHGRASREGRYAALTGAPCLRRVSEKSRQKTGCFYRGLMVRLTALTIATALLASFWSTRVSAQTATTPGAITTPYPTTQGISIEWAIMGDSNNNSVVTVRYRPAGTTTWKTGMACSAFRGQQRHRQLWVGKRPVVEQALRELFDLDPGTSYEIELTLTDPDGDPRRKPRRSRRARFPRRQRLQRPRRSRLPISARRSRAPHLATSCSWRPATTPPSP